MSFSLSRSEAHVGHPQAPAEHAQGAEDDRREITLVGRHHDACMQSCSLLLNEFDTEELSSLRPYNLFFNRLPLADIAVRHTTLHRESALLVRL